MKNLLDWIKSNIITSISIAVTVAALAVIVVFYIKGSTFQGQLAQRADKIQQIRRFSQQTVSLPSEDPNEPPEQKRNLTINQALIGMKKKINQKMRGQLTGTAEAAVRINKKHHRQLIKAMFPNPDNQQAFDARDAYLRAFAQMRSALDAGVPPSAQQIQDALNKVRSQYGRGPQSNASSSLTQSGNFSMDIDTSKLSDQDKQRLREDLRQRLTSLLRSRAQSMHIYVPSADLDNQGQFSQNFPFDVGTWAYQSDLPRDWQLWEAQLELWIQQDIVRAIAMANQADDNKISVINAPVKRLLNLQVIPGYVGLQTIGGVDQNESSNQNNSFRNRVSRSNVQTSEENGYPPPVGGQTGNGDDLLTGNYYLSPTGRVSNGLYDVRHVRLSVIADIEQLPKLFDALAQVNFMTVLDMRIENVNEYDALHQGYVYGPGDAARVEMVIETLWLRQWTNPLMPEKTKVYVGEKPAPEGQTQQPGYPPGGQRYR